MFSTLAEVPPPTVRLLNIPDDAAGVRRKLRLMVQLARKGKLHLDILRAFLDAVAESIAHPALATIERGGTLAFRLAAQSAQTTRLHSLVPYLTARAARSGVAPSPIGCTERQARRTTAPTLNDTQRVVRSQRSNPMSKLFEVSMGDVLIEKESDEVFTVTKLYPESGCAVLENTEGQESAVGIKNLLDAIESGDLAFQEDGDGEEE